MSTATASVAPLHARVVTRPFVVTVAATFGYFLSVGATLPLLPRFVTGPLRGGGFDVGLTVAAFGAAALLARPLAGRFGDRRGRRPLLIASAVLVSLATAGLLLADSVATLVALRVVAGAGEAAFFVAAASIVNDLAPPTRRGEALSLFSLALYAGMAVGPYLGEGLLDGRGFPGVWLAAAAAAAAAALLAVCVRETRPPGSGGPPAPLVHRGALRPGAALAASIVSLTAFLAFVPLVALERGLGGARHVMLLYAVVVLGVRSLGARLPDRFGHGRTARTSLVVTAGGMLLVGLSPSVPALLVGTVVFAAGQGLAFPALMAMTVSDVAPHERGAAVATFMAFFDVAFAAGGLVLGALAEALDLSWVFAAAGAASALGLLALVARPRAVRT